MNVEDDFISRNVRFSRVLCKESGNWRSHLDGVVFDQISLHDGLCLYSWSASLYGVEGG